MQTILKDKPSQFAVGIFVGTFALPCWRCATVVTGGAHGGGQVPGLAVVVAFHAGGGLDRRARALRPSHRTLVTGIGIDRAGRPDTRRLLDTHTRASPTSRLRPRMGRSSRCTLGGGMPRGFRPAGRTVDETAIARSWLVPAFGEFVSAAVSPLLLVHGDPHATARRPRGHSVVLGLERTLEQDVSYGLRLLVDIAERSLSDSPFLDPTTAVQAIDRLHDCLRHLARRDFPDGVHHDRAGNQRLIIRVMNWGAYVHLAYDEIRQAGAGSPQVARRLRASLQDLLDYALPERREALREPAPPARPRHSRASTRPRSRILALARPPRHRRRRRTRRLPTLAVTTTNDVVSSVR